MIKILRQRILDFLQSNKEYPIIAAIASGLYPLLHCYNSNFTLVNSWSQFLFFVSLFLVFPIVLFLIITKIARTKYLQGKAKEYLIPVLNIFLFIVFVFISMFTFSISYKKVIVLFAMICFAVIFNRHYRKIILFQLLLAFVALFELVPNVFNYIIYSNNWMEQPDEILDVKFKNHPNIYIIQPDGYANFSELEKGYYNYDNSQFTSYLKENGFKIYNDFRSNYITTLTSNSSMFTMKHHYYEHKKGMTELYGARDVIVGENPVISIFKNNNYNTFLMLEKPYLLMNRPEIGYDNSNIDYSEVPFLTTGFILQKDVKEDVKRRVLENLKAKNFFFIEKMTPGHVATRKKYSRGKENERKDYLVKVEETNLWLQDLILFLNKNDPNSLIVIVADHGGFVGMDYTRQIFEKQTDRDLIYSAFSSALAIKWPNKAPKYDDKLKTSVNLFRIIFSYLSDNEEYLNYLQKDKSYAVVNKNWSNVIYEYINEKGEIVSIRKTKLD